MKRISTASRWLFWCASILLLIFTPISYVFAQICVEPPPGIVAWWTLDETSGTTTMDIVGNNDGTHVGGPIPMIGLVDGALRFNGSTDYVVVPDSDLWAFGSHEFTIEFWANFDVPAHGSTGHPGDVFISHDQGPFNVPKWFFALNSSTLDFLTCCGPNWAFSPNAPFAPVVGQWYHLAVTRSGTDYRIYVDGQLVTAGPNSATIPNINSVLTIGRALEPFGGFMNGFLDEMTIYHRALSEAELLAIANAGDAGKCKGITIETESLSAVKLGESFSQKFEAIFGDPPLTWSITNGSLPDGVTLSSNGTLSGASTEAGEFNFTVKVEDSSGDFDEKPFTLKVLVALPPPDIRIHKVGTIAVPGRTLDYFIIVENVSDIDTEDIVVTEILDPWFTLVNSSPTPLRIQTVSDFFPDPTSVDVYDAIITWIIPIMSPGESRVITYSATLDPLYSIGSIVRGFSCQLDGCPPPDFCIDCELQLKDCFEIKSKECVEEFGQPPRRDDVGYANCMYNGQILCRAELLLCVMNQNEGLRALQINSSVSQTCSIDEQPSTAPIDPNEKLVSANRFIQPDQLLVYPIHFENIGDVEALDVFVTDVLDSNLDTSTLEILTPGGSFNSSTRTLKWDLLGRNLQPGETGNVLFSIRPKSGLSSGTEIRNKAEIQFEIFDPLVTPEVVNIIDSTSPSCTMDSLPEETTNPEFSISWNGTDTVGEIDTYSIFVSEDGVGYTPFLQGTSETNATFNGEVGKTYRFICIATDTAGNTEVQDPVAEAITGVREPPVIEVVIDIKPGSDPNSINPDGKGVIPVAILTTNGFDATTVDPLSVRFGPDSAVESHGRGHIEDVDGDGDDDMVLHFRTQETGIQCGDTEAGLSGITMDGQEIEGADSVRTVDCQ